MRWFRINRGSEMAEVRRSTQMISVITLSGLLASALMLSGMMRSDVIIGRAAAESSYASDTLSGTLPAGRPGRPAEISYQLSRAEHFYQQGAWLQSLRLARQIVSIQPDDQNALRLMLDSMARLQVIGRKAEAAITLARRLRPDDPVILASIAKLRTAQGREAEAGSARASFAATCPFNCSQIMNR